MRRASLSLLLLFLLSGCGATGLITTIEIKLTPSTRTLGPGDRVTFTGTETTTDLTGLTITTETTAFDWTIEEGDAGGTLRKTRGDTTTYTYTAPERPGVYHVMIRSKKDPSQTARATLTVN